MTRPFISRSVLLVFVFILFIPCFTTAGESPPDDIKKAAKEGVTTFLKDSRSSHLRRLGFESQTDVDNAELGEGFQIFTIHPDKLLNESASQELHDLVTPTTQWQFLILARGKANALLTVDLVNEKWTPVSIGSSGLAKQLSDLLVAWPATSGYQYRLIRVYQAQSDFIELSQGGKNIGILPLTSLLTAIKRGARKAFNPHDLRDPKEVLSDLRPVVRKNIQFKR
jgi:hypothetical protein